MMNTHPSQIQILNTLVEKSELLSWIKGVFVGQTLKEIPLHQVGKHDRMDDCWIVLYDKVYNITFFVDKHPGGEDVMLEYAGRDATFAFENIGHDLKVLKTIQQNLVGQLPKDECIFTRKEEIELKTL